MYLYIIRGCLVLTANEGWVGVQVQGYSTLINVFKQLNDNKVAHQKVGASIINSVNFAVRERVAIAA